MKLKNGKYGCIFCPKEFESPMEAYAHTQDAHEFVLVPLLKEELSRILMFIFNPSSPEVLPEKAIRRMQDLLKHNK